MYLLIISICLALLNWTALIKQSRRGVLITKPGMMVFLIAWVVSQSGFPEIIGSTDSAPLLWILLGLFFSLVGDIFLMLSPKFFLPGLAAFLITHIFYIFGFGSLQTIKANSIPSALIGLPILIIGAAGFSQIARGLNEKRKKRFLLPVGAYAVIISIMVFNALMTWFTFEWEATSALLAAVGAILFYSSDAVNAWRRFVQPIPNHEIKIMVTYHLGQFAIAISAVLHIITSS